MGGGSPVHSTAEEDDSRSRFPYGNQSPCASVSGFEVENLYPASSSKGEVLQVSGVSTFANGQPKLSTYGSRGPGISCNNVKSEPKDEYVNDLESGDDPVFRFNGRVNQLVASETLDLRDFSSRTETLEDVGPLRNVSPSLTPSTASTYQPASESVQHVRKRTFKLMEIQNDNQDLSFVEKVILSVEEIFGLCNNIAARSAKSSEGRRVIDFGMLDSKTMKVIGFFGSKNVMKDIFQRTKFREQTDIWMQIQNDTFAPGLYAWLEGDFLFVFYWHQGHYLPEATRKDMSCNFIRYVFDLCDTVCICLENQNLKNSLFESVPRFAKRQRTKRLQISLVKSSEDSVKVTDGFYLNLGLSPGGKNRLNRNISRLELASCHDFKVSEGVSRVALLFSSTRCQQLSSVKVEEKLNVSSFPSYLKKWTVDNDYSLDLQKLSDSDLVVFIRSSKLKEAEDYEKLLECNTRRKKEERKKKYDVDLQVENEENCLSRCIEAFLDLFLKAKYPWEENLTILSSGVYLSFSHEVEGATEKMALQSDHQQLEKAIQSGHHSSPPTNLFNQSQSESHPPPSEKGERATRDRLRQIENEIYDLLFDKNSKHRVVFPASVVYIIDSFSRIPLDVWGKRLYAITVDGEMIKSRGKFSPICYGDKVVVRSVGTTSAAVMAGKVLRQSDIHDRGPLLTDEPISFMTDGYGKRTRWLILQPYRRTGDLSERLDMQAADIQSPCGWKHAAFVTALAQKLAQPGHSFDEMNVDQFCHILVSENPFDSLETTCSSEELLVFARRKWEELQVLPAEISPDMQEESICKEVKDLYVDLYKTFRSNLESKISCQIRRFASPLLQQKVRKQCSESYERLELTLNEQEATFLASLRDSLSRRKEGAGPLTLTFEKCKLLERPGSVFQRLKKLTGGDEKISISLTRQQFERESLTWHGFELAPMKEGLDQLIIDNEYAFSPSCSASQEIIDLDPSSQTLVKIFFLKTGQLLVLTVESHQDSEDVLHIFLCPKLGVKLCEANRIRQIKRGFDMIGCLTAVTETEKGWSIAETVLSTFQLVHTDDGQEISGICLRSRVDLCVQEEFTLGYANPISI